MPVEFDDSGLRVIGNNVIALGWYDDARTLQQAIYLKSDNTLNIGDIGTGASGTGTTETTGGAPDAAQYLVMSLNDGLPNCRRLDIGAGLTAVDMGAGSDYDLSVNTAWAPTWTGVHTFTAATTMQATLTSYSIVPATTDTYDLGTSSKLFRKAYISELEAFVMVENTVSLIGGWLVVPHGQGSLAADLADSDDTCDFGKAMTVDDWVLMRAFGQVEYFLVGANVAGTVYKIGADASGDRDIDGSGANDWPAGTAFMVMGQDGDGRIELDGSGPNISVIIQGDAYNTTTEPVKIDGDGISVIAGSAAYVANEAYKLYLNDGTSLAGYLGATLSVGGYHVTELRSASIAGEGSYLHLTSVAPNSELSYIQLQAVETGGTTTTVYIRADGYMSLPAPTDLRVGGGLFVGGIGTDPDAGWIYADDGIYIGDTANTKQTMGLTINQAANDDEILSLKSSDVAHGMTDNTETDTWLAIQKAEATSGGANLIGYKDADGVAGFALTLTGRLGEAADTTKSTAAVAPVVLRAQIKSGTGVADVGTDGNLAVIRNGSTTRYIFDAEGSAHADVEWVAFDEHDDVALLDAFETTMAAARDPVKAEFSSFIDDNAAELEALGLVHFDRDNPGHAMVNTTRMMMLLTGAIRQNRKLIQEIAMLPG